MYVVELSVEVHTTQTHALSHLPCWELGLSSNNSNTAAQAHVMLSAAARTRLTKAIDGIGGRHLTLSDMVMNEEKNEVDPTDPTTSHSRVHSRGRVVGRVVFLSLIMIRLVTYADNDNKKWFWKMGSSTKKQSLNSGKEYRHDLPRGSSGRWILDFNYSYRHDYPNYGSYSTWHIAAQNFTPTNEQPYRLAASYRWVDDSHPKLLNGTAAPGYGPLREISLDEFCAACHKLNISRILSLGDSLSNQFKQSLLSLLGFPPQGRAATGFNANLRPQTIRCTTPESFDIQVMWMRRSALHEVLSLSAGGNHAMHEAFIADNQNKTAVVANFGTWLKTIEEFQQALEAFLSWIDTSPLVESKEKLGPIFFRETIPGHYPCKPEGKKENVETYDWKVPLVDAPFESYREYRNFSDTYVGAPSTYMYQWQQFEAYNEYALGRLLNRSESAAAQTLPIYWLNVFNSSVLRRDGHIGFGDGLHYYLPGPPDFWSHFFHSYICELACL